MYDLHLTPEQLEIRDTVRDFVTRAVKPLALEPARLEARERPLLVEALHQASRMGLRTLALPEELGGAGADNLTCCIVTEELAAGDPDVAAVLTQTATLAHALFARRMTPAQHERFLPAFLSDDRYHLALAEHEPNQRRQGAGRERAACQAVRGRGESFPGTGKGGVGHNPGPARHARTERA